MAPFSIPAPCIIPLRVPIFGARRTIDTQTKVELVCETCINHEVFYTLDGTKPQPYEGIVQGSKLYKYQSPFCLPAGKVTIKAIALNAHVRTMRSSVVTKCFEVLKGESEPAASGKVSKKKRKKKVSPEAVVESNLQDALIGTNHQEQDIMDSAFDEGNKKDLYMEDPCSSVEDFPINTEALHLNGEDTSDSSHGGFSGTSVIGGGGDQLNDAKYENETPVSSEPQSPAKEHLRTEHVGDGLGGEENTLKVGSKVCTCSVNSESRLCCMKCEASLQYCLTCNTPNATTSKYCIQCGQKLMHKCNHCKEFNYVIATFCQFCGSKLQFSEEENELNILSVDCSVMAKPQRSHVSVQQSPSSLNKQTQTLPERKDRKAPQRLPSHSPGRGYWHQQLDYICNHLKSYAYNNNEFRESISEPMLSEFQTAKVDKSDDNVSITIVFSPLTLGEKE